MGEDFVSKAIIGGKTYKIVPIIDMTEANAQNASDNQKIDAAEARQRTLEQKTSLYFHLAASITSSLLAQRKQTAAVLAIEATLSIALTTAAITRMTMEAIEAGAKHQYAKSALLFVLAGVLTWNLVKQQITRIQANQLRDYTAQIKEMRSAHGI